MVERAEEQVHPDDPERFLLVDVRFVEHPHMNDDLTRLAARLRLETHPQPSVRFVMLLETARRHRIGENKKGAYAAELLVQSLDQQLVFVVEHGLETITAHVAVGRSVDRVAERHVVGRHRFRHGSRRAAHVEKTPRHFLAGADFGEGAVLLRVEINLERFLVRPEIHLRLHALTRCGTSPAFTTRPELLSHSLGAARGDPTSLIVWQRGVYPVAALAQDLDFAAGG